MPFSHKNYWIGMTVVVLTAVAAACQRTNFDSSHGDKQPAGELDKEEPAADAGDEQEIDDPEQVAGTFLTCAAAADADAPAPGSGWLCRIDRDGAVADLSLGAVTWTMTDAAGIQVASLPGAAETGPVARPAIKPLVNAAPWHVAVFYPAAPAGATVTADVNWADGTTSKLQASLTRTADPIWHIGADRDIHLGDGEYPEGGCKGPIAQTPLTGAKMSIPLTVTSETSLTIEISAVCGIDYDEVVLEIRNAGGVVHTSKLPVGVAHIKLPPVKLPKGKLTLTLEPQPSAEQHRLEDRDDFVFGSIYFSGLAFSLGVPTAK